MAISKPDRSLIIKVLLPVKNHKGDKIVRSYKSLGNAIIGTIRWLLINGKVGHKCVIYHERTALEFGCIRLNVKGEIASNFAYKDYLD